ncbi:MULTISPECIES: hypothetical protein [Nostocales]|uniref:Transposase n=2 Tax=Nostocales TaxID=1161 RepID=A0ABW8WSC5_9CYAN|nr:hypothetical protein [Tolypothrix bouteillei]
MSEKRNRFFDSKTRLSFRIHVPTYIFNSGDRYPGNFGIPIFS